MEGATVYPLLLSGCALSCPDGSYPYSSSFLPRNGTSSFLLYCTSRKIDERPPFSPKEYRLYPNQSCFYSPEPVSSHSRRFVVKGVALMFSPLLRRHETSSENSSPNNLAALPDKDGCKNRLYRYRRRAFFRTSEESCRQSISGKRHFRQGILAKPAC